MIFTNFNYYRNQWLLMINEKIVINNEYWYLLSIKVITITSMSNK